MSTNTPTPATGDDTTPAPASATSTRVHRAERAPDGAGLTGDGKGSEDPDDRCPGCGVFEGEFCHDDCTWDCSPPAMKRGPTLARLLADVALPWDLLAIIHSDGGHHTEKVGLAQSVSDAVDKVTKLRGEVERLTEQGKQDASIIDGFCGDLDRLTKDAATATLTIPGMPEDGDFFEQVLALANGAKACSWQGMARLCGEMPEDHMFIRAAMAIMDMLAADEACRKAPRQAALLATSFNVVSNDPRDRSRLVAATLDDPGPAARGDPDDDAAIQEASKAPADPEGRDGVALDQRSASDCMRCCVAFVLGLTYEEVPDFVTEYDDRWSVELAAWASGRGWTMLRFQTPRAGIRAMVPDGASLWIADGPGPRGTDHAVVFRGEEMVHDPHPSRDGLSHAHGVTVLVRKAGPS